MTVPARPLAGALLDSAWGGIVHDEVVAMEFQTGSMNVNVVTGGNGTTAIVFPHPFAAIPIVWGQISGNAGNKTILTFTNATVNGCTAEVNAATVWNYGAWWIAYGARV